MPILSRLARSAKARMLLGDLDRTDRILEIGAGSGQIGAWLRRRGFTHYVGLDLQGPADVVGDVRNWPALGLAPGSFDAVIAFEVVEHVDCFEAAWDLLKPGGRLLVTTPVPAADPWLARLERIGLTQPRTSPHDHLVDLRAVPWRGKVEVRRIAGLAQWGRLTRQETP